MTPIQPFSCFRTLDQFVEQSEIKPLLERICRIAAAALAAISTFLADLTTYVANKIYSTSLILPQENASHLQEAIEKALSLWGSRQDEVRQAIKDAMLDEWNILQMSAEWAIAYSLENFSKPLPAYLKQCPALADGTTISKLRSSFRSLPSDIRQEVLTKIRLQERGSPAAQPYLDSIRALASEIQQGNQLYYDAFCDYIETLPMTSVIELTTASALETGLVLPPPRKMPTPSAPEMPEHLYHDLSVVDAAPQQTRPTAPELVEEDPETKLAKDLLFLKQELQKLPDNYEVHIRIQLISNPQTGQKDFKSVAFITLCCLHHACKSHDAIRIPGFVDLDMTVDQKTLREFLNGDEKETFSEELLRFAEILGESGAFISAFDKLRSELALTSGI